MMWELIVMRETCGQWGRRVQTYKVPSLAQAYKERMYITKLEPSAIVLIKRVKQ